MDSIGQKYEVLKSLPPYGPIHVSITRDGEKFYSEGFVVRFFKSDGTDWVANFQPGWTKFSTVTELSASCIVVIASGTCYVVDPDAETAVFDLGVDYAAILKLPDGRHVLQGQTDLTILEPSGSYWHTERISWDGIKELHLDDDGLVHGIAFDPGYDEDEWVPFIYDIDRKELVGGSFRDYSVSE